MNEFTLTLLAAAVLPAVLLHLADALNLRTLTAPPPSELDTVYDAGDLERARSYTRDRTRWRMLRRTVDLALLLGFWGSGGFAWLDHVVATTALPAVLQGLLYFGALLSGMALLGVPFSLYSTFVIEQRHGFNRTTPRLWLFDAIKGAAIAVLLGAPLLSATLWLFHTAGNTAWLYAWAVLVGVQLMLRHVAPRWILPLFNRYAPLGEGPLREAVLRYIERVRFPLRDVYVMDGSRRSTRANAFFTGMGKQRRVVLFDTLLEKLTVDEVVAVLAHEIGHFRRKHLHIGAILAALRAGAVLWLLSLLLDAQGWTAALGFETHSVHAAMLAFGLLYAPLSMLLDIPLHALSRKHEFEADGYAVNTHGRPEDLITALIALTRNNLGNLTPHPLFVLLHGTHPPLPERIAAIRAARRPPHRSKLKFRLRDLV
jgi:STE24 endopeptidase